VLLFAARQRWKHFLPLLENKIDFNQAQFTLKAVVILHNCFSFPPLLQRFFPTTDAIAASGKLALSLRGATFKWNNFLSDAGNLLEISKKERKVEKWKLHFIKIEGEIKNGRLWTRGI
jgi:hypothetical protein